MKSSTVKEVARSLAIIAAICAATFVSLLLLVGLPP